MVLFGALASVASAFVVSGQTQIPASWVLVVVASAVTIAGLWPQLRRSSRRIVAAVAVLMAAAAAIFVSETFGGLGSPLVASAMLGVVTLIGWRGPRRKLFLGLSALAVLIAGAVYHRWTMAFPVTADTAVLPWAGAGVAFAAVAVLTQLPRHVLIAFDRVGTEHSRALADCDGEIRELSDRALTLWRQAEDFLAIGDANRDLLEEAVLRLFEAAKRWNEVEKHSRAVDRDKLGARLAELDSRIESASDSVVLAQYQAAREALSEQLRYLGDISHGRDRVLARMHNYLAEMERFNLALANLKSTDASREAIEIQPMAAALADLGKDIDALGESLEA